MLSLKPISLADLMLSRLLLADEKGLTKSELKSAVKTIVASQLSASALTERLEQVFSQLEEKGHIQSVSPARFKITEAGRQHSLKPLGLDALPSKMQWSRLKNTDLIACAFGLTPLTAETRKRIGDANGLRAAILKNAYKLPTADFSTLTTTRNALLWQQLCTPTVAERLQSRLPQLNEQPFNQGAVMGVLLNDLLAVSSPLKWEKALNQLVAKAAAARRTDPNELRAAVLRQAIAQDLAESTQPISEPPESVAAVSQPAIENFADAVLKAAKATQEGRFGEHKVLISQVWKTFQTQQPESEINQLETFKQRIMDASRQQLLELSRADLGYSIDSEEIAASESIHMQSKFHFIRVE